MLYCICDCSEIEFFGVFGWVLGGWGWEDAVLKVFFFSGCKTVGALWMLCLFPSFYAGGWGSRCEMLKVYIEVVSYFSRIGRFFFFWDVRYSVCDIGGGEMVLKNAGMSIRV